MVTIPLRFIITPFTFQGQVEQSQWDCSQAQAILLAANKIWAAARIQFSQTDCIAGTPIDMRQDARSDEQILVNYIETQLYKPGNTVDIFLINSVPNLNSDGTPDKERWSYIQKFGNADSEGRMMAHEFGHMLALDHVSLGHNASQGVHAINNLMHPGLTIGTQLTPFQIGKAQGSKLARQFGGGKHGH